MKKQTRPNLKKLTLHSLLISTLLACTITVQAQSWVWSKSAGGSGNDNGRTMAVDASGNVYVAGWFSSTSIAFGTTTLTQAGSGDMYIVKYDPSGNVLWAKSAGGTGSDDARGITIDASGNVYVVGNFSSTSIMFGSTTLTNSGGGDVYVVKYDGTGSVLWAKSAGGTSTDAGESVAIDGSGNVIVAGWFTSPSIVIGATTLTNAGNSDIMLLKYDASGTFVWATAFGGSGDEHPTAVKADGTGNVFFSGYYTSGSIAFGSTTLTNSGVYDMVVVKCNNSGSTTWAKSAGGGGDDEAQSIALDAAGNIYVAGNFTSPSITFGSTTLTNAGTSVFDFYLTKYDGAGTVLWAKRGGAADNDEAFSVTTDASGNAYITGGYSSTSMSLGTSTLTNVSAGNDDVYIVKYDASGNVIWAKSAGSTGDDYSNCVAVDGSGNVYITGYYDNTITFGSLTAMSNAGLNDIFVAKLSSTTGVGEVSSSAGMELYPNPAKSRITIASKLPVDEIVITNAVGQQVLDFKVMSDRITIDIGHLPTGVYFVKMNDGRWGTFDKH